MPMNSGALDHNNIRRICVENRYITSCIDALGELKLSVAMPQVPYNILLS